GRMPAIHLRKFPTGEKVRGFGEYSAPQAVSALLPDRRSTCCSISSWLKCLLPFAFAGGPRRVSGSSRTRASGCPIEPHLRSDGRLPVSVLPAHSAAYARVRTRFDIRKLYVDRSRSLRHPLTSATGQVVSTVRPFSGVRVQAALTLARSDFPGLSVAHAAW